MSRFIFRKVNGEKHQNWTGFFDTKDQAKTWYKKHGEFHLGRGNELELFEVKGAKGKSSWGRNNVKLKENEVKQIKMLLSSGLSQAEVSMRFGVSQSTIYQISSGATWSHIK